jgi:putative nucleotidyltransferase with HDIG domain
LFTTEFFKLIPRLCLGDRSPEGFLAAYAKHKDAYFFAMYFPKRMLWKRIVRAFSRNNKTVDHTMNSIKQDAHTEWDEYKKMVTRRVINYSQLHDLVEKELCLAAERFRDIGSVDPSLYAKVSRKVELFEEDIEKLRALRPQWLETSLNLELAEPSDLLDLGETLSEPYAEGAALEQRLEESWSKLNGYENKAVQMLVEGYQHAEDKVKFIKEFLAVLAEKDTWINHPYRVSDLAGEMCRRANELGVTGIDPEIAMRAGLLHDWGKLLVPRAILEKPGKLDDWEFDVIMKHPTHGMQILDGIGFSQEALASGYHHEYYDGSRGYPKQKKGPVIPEIARLVAYADVLDAIAAASLDRKYDKVRQGRVRDWKDAVEEIHRCTGTQLDPLFLPAFDAMVEDGFVRQFYADKTRPYKSQSMRMPTDLV